MKSVQFDKNNNDDRLIDKCNAGNRVECRSIPHGLRDAPDPEILRFSIRTGRLLLTFDRQIATEEKNTPVIASGFPGILVISFDDDDDKVRHLTTIAAGKILAQFKGEFPAWDTVPWNNSVVELQPHYIYVNHVAGARVVRTKFISRRDAGWQTALGASLLLNSSATHGPTLLDD